MNGRRILQVTETDGFYMSSVRVSRFAPEITPQVESTMQRVSSLFEQYVKLCQSLNQETIAATLRLDDIGRLSDTIAANLQLSIEEKQELLEIFDPADRLNRVSDVLDIDPLILKPAPQATFTALALGEVILKAGWPEEALAVLPLSNADTAWLAEKEDRIKLLSFTGSAKVGWELKAHSGRKRVLLELGGNAALVVHSDWKDLDDAAQRTAHAAFSYAGQSCISVQRVFVERSIFQTFVWKVVDVAAKLATGNPADEATEVGPMIRQSDAERVEAWVKEAVDAGAKLVAGGERNGSVITPTILTATAPGMKVRDEEVFGPVLMIEPYDDFEEALAAVNHSKYGLQAGLMTRDSGRILTAYRELEVGALIVGDTPAWRLDPMPYGGVKDSGLGREGLRSAIDEMTEPRMLVMTAPR